MAHRSSLSLLACLTLAAVTSGCGRKDAAPAPGNEPTSAAPAPQPEPAKAALPPNGFGSVPGWLGFAVQPADTRTHHWTPAHPDASVVIVDADEWSETTAKDARFRLISREGNQPLTASGVSRVPHGCDGNERPMAGFRAAQAVAEQLVWILPDGNETAAAVPVTAAPASDTGRSLGARSFTVGPLAITVRLDNPLGGNLRVHHGDKLALTQPFEKPAMAGADMAPLDLTKDLEIGVPYPEAAFRIDPALTIVVLRTVTYEGVTFDVLALRGDEVEHAGTQYVYLCAF
jgi:hypothetical protein